MEKISKEAFNELVISKESEVLEFKQAKVNFSENSLFDYTAAIANEGGGKLILGVNDEGKAVGTTVYSGTENKIPYRIFSLIGLKVAVNSYIVSEIDKRIVVIDIPSRPIGRPVRSKGKYGFPMRVGESLSEMDDQTLGKIFKEISPDYSCSIVDELKITDLNSNYIEKFKNLWSVKADRVDFLEKNNAEVLSSLNLIDGDKISLTALILFGTKSSLGKYFPDAEIVFEWRTEKNKTNFDFRKSWREGFIGVFDDIWEALNVRNSRQSYQDGLVQKEISAFDEKPFREALLNAVAHRDYSLTGQSIFIKANPESYSVESPGGLIGGVNLTNMLHKSAWRNRNLAEALEKAGLVERSGQGIDDIFEISIRNGKGSSSEFQDAFPELTKKSIDNLLQSLRRERKIYFDGHSKFGVWKLVD